MLCRGYPTIIGPALMAHLDLGSFVALGVDIVKEPWEFPHLTRPGRNGRTVMLKQGLVDLLSPKRKLDV